MAEFPEQKIDIADLAEQTLTTAYFRLRGEYPKEGGYRPNEETSSELSALFGDLAELVEFLKLSIALHVWMIQTGKNPDNVPFYVNKHLLAPKRLEALEQYAHVIRAHYGNKLEHIRGFEEEVYADVSQVEVDYIYLASAATMHGDPTRLDLIRPTLFWVLASKLLGRLGGLKTSRGCPVIYADVVVKHNGQKMFFEQAWSGEVKKLTSSPKREELFIDRACTAINDARRDWGVKSGLLQFIRDDFGHNEYKNISGVDMALLTIRAEDAESPSYLADADRDLFAYAKQWLEGNGTHFQRPEGQRIVLEQADNVMDKADGLRIMSEQPLAPILSSLLDD